MPKTFLCLLPLLLLVLSTSLPAQPNFQNVQPEIITLMEDTDPWVSADALTMVHTRDSEIGTGENRDILIATRATPSSPWNSSSAITNINTHPVVNAEPWVSPDLLRIYFRRGSSPEIYMAARSVASNDFNSPVMLSGPINGGFSTADPSLTSDELTIVVTHREDSGPDSDIYMATRTSILNPFGPLEKISEISTTDVEDAAWISSDGHYIIWHSQPVTGDRDLYFSSRTSTFDPFSSPQPMQSLNTPGDDETPFFEENSETLYFSRSSSGDEASIYSAQPIDLQIGIRRGNPGDVLSVPVTALTDFVDVEQLVFRIEYDPAEVNFQNVVVGDAGGTLTTNVSGGVISVTIDYPGPVSGSALHLVDLEFEIPVTADTTNYTPLTFKDLTGGFHGVNGLVAQTRSDVKVWGLFR